MPSPITAEFHGSQFDNQVRGALTTGEPFFCPKMGCMLTFELFDVWFSLDPIGGSPAWTVCCREFDDYLPQKEIDHMVVYVIQ